MSVFVLIPGAGRATR